MFEDIAAKLRTRLDELSAGKWRTYVRMVDISIIYPNPFHAPIKLEERELKDLISSIKTEGIRTPLTVQAAGTAQNPRYHLVAGEKIYRACIHGGISPVPCVILDANPERAKKTGDVSASQEIPEENTLQAAVGGTKIPQRIDLSAELLQDKLTILRCNAKEKRLILEADLSTEGFLAFENLPPRLRQEIYKAIEQGVSGKPLEEAIEKLSENQPKTKYCIKNTGFFFNSVDKAVKTMNESGIPIKCTREERKTFTKLTIIVPKQI